jgi:hypothetical protein
VTIAYSIGISSPLGGTAPDTPDIVVRARILSEMVLGESIEVEASGQGGGLATAVDAKLGEDVRDVMHDRARAD